MFNPGKPDGLLATASQTKFRSWDPHACEIDERLKPGAGELVIHKDAASAFFGTHLAPFLIVQGVDTVIVTGCSTSACILATVMDTMSFRFRPVVPRHGVQDRAEESHVWNLFDVATKFADVQDLEQTWDYIEQWKPEE